METLLASLVPKLISLSPWLLPAIIILYVSWNWNTRNNVERLFLSKNVVLFQKGLTESIIFIAFTFLSLFSPPENMDTLLNGNTTLNTILYLVYMFIYFLYFLDSQYNFKKIKNEKWLKIINKPFLTMLWLFLLMVLAAYLYRYLIQLSSIIYWSFLEADIERAATDSSEVSTNDVFSFVANQVFVDDSFLLLIPFLIWSIISYLLFRLSFKVIARKTVNNLNDKEAMKITVVLKNGRKFEGVYMQNNPPGKFFHFHNRPSSPTQQVVINKEEIEYLIFNETKHRFQDDIKQRNK